MKSSSLLRRVWTKKETKMIWTCRKCGHEVISDSQPQPIKWTDGHVCYLYPEEPKTIEQIEVQKETRK